MTKPRRKGNTGLKQNQSVRKSQGILVLGMHRSGTSALTRVLNLLGCALPEELLGNGGGNANGHWESRDAVTLNDEILDSAGTNWQDWGTINADWHSAAIKADMVDRAAGVLADHADLGGLFVLKDPRICRLTDVWFEAADNEGIDLHCVITLRNPAEVATSLETRDLMQPKYAHLLWLRYVLDAEHFTRGRKRVFCSYDQLIDNWQNVVGKIREGLALSLPRNSQAVHAQIEQFLSPRHRHHNEEARQITDNPGLSRWLRRTFAILLNWSEHQENAADYDELDTIRGELDNAHPAFAALLLDAGITGGAESGIQLRTLLDEKVKEATSATENAEARIRESGFKLSRLSDENEQLQQREAELTERISRLQVDLEAARLDGPKAEASEARLKEVEGLLQAALERASVEGERADAAEGGLGELKEQQAELAEELERFKRTADANAQESSQLRAALAAEEAQRQAMQDHSAQLAEKHEAKMTELQEKAIESATLSARLSTVESALAQRQEELSQLYDQLLKSEKEAGGAQIEAKQERERRVDAELRIEQLESEKQELRKGFDEMSDRVSQLDAASRFADDRNAVTEQKLSERFDEIAHLTTMLVEKTGDANASGANIAWLRRMIEIAESFPAWWAVLPRKWRQKRQQDFYASAGVFDASWYLETYPDVAENGMDPVRHYMLHGMHEGRRPSN